MMKALFYPKPDKDGNIVFTEKEFNQFLGRVQELVNAKDKEVDKELIEFLIKEAKELGSIVDLWEVAEYISLLCIKYNIDKDYFDILEQIKLVS